jgi:hypothetical protein
MADRRLLGIANGIANGMDKATTNLQNIMKASYEIKQNQELLNLKKKAIEADNTQNAWEKDYKLKALDLSNKELAVKEKTASLANEKTTEELAGIKRVAKLFELKYGPALRGEKSVDDLGPMDINTVTGNVRNTSGEQAITDASGNVIGYRPKGSVFQPKDNSATPMFAEEETAMPSNNAQDQSVKVRVKHIQSGKTGTIDSSEFDPKLYEKI